MAEDYLPILEAEESLRNLRRLAQNPVLNLVNWQPGVNWWETLEDLQRKLPAMRYIQGHTPQSCPTHTSLSRVSPPFLLLPEACSPTMLPQAAARLRSAASSRYIAP